MAISIALVVCMVGSIPVFIVGLVALIGGKISLKMTSTKQYKLTGQQARLAGIGLIVLAILMQVLANAMK